MFFDLIIYHANCLDGFTAAWVAARYGNQPKAEFMPGDYNKPIPDIEFFRDKSVLILDFSYKADVLRQIGEVSAGVIVLDHHKSAAEELQHFPSFDAGSPLSFMKAQAGKENVLVSFDMARSGAMMTWNFFQPNMDALPIVTFVQDRDLWNFEFGDHTRYVNSYLTSLEMTFPEWDMASNGIVHDIGEVVDQGRAITRKQDKDIQSALEHAFFAKIGGYAVPIVNMPYQWASDGANALAKKYPNHPFAVSFYVNSTGDAVLSLRSLGFDVSDIAKMYGGGGHRKAAGCRVSFEQIIMSEEEA